MASERKMYSTSAGRNRTLPSEDASDSNTSSSNRPIRPHSSYDSKKMQPQKTTYHVVATNFESLSSRRESLVEMPSEERPPAQMQRRMLRSAPLGIRLMDHTSHQQLVVTPASHHSNNTPAHNILRKTTARPRLSQSNTMSEIINCYKSPSPSNMEAESDRPPPTPLPRGEWHNTPLHMAAEHGVVVKMREFLEKDCEESGSAKPAIELPGDPDDGDRPLHLAAKGGYLDAAQLLLQYGATIDAPNRFQDTPLILAVKGGHANVVKFLIQSKAVVSARGRNGQTAFHWACATGNAELLQILIDASVQNGGELDVSRMMKAQDFTESGNNAFHLAALGNHVAIARRLVAHEPEIAEAKNSAQYNALHLAARCGWLEMVRWLVDEQMADIESPGWLGKTPLHKAVETGRLEVVTFLLERGANIEAVEMQLGGTPLHTAAMYGQAVVARFLLSRGADISRETAHFSMLTTHVAALYGNHAVLAVLINRIPTLGINTKGNLGRTPLHLAASSGQLQTVEYMVKHGARLEEKDEATGGTALHFSCWFGHVPVMEYLIRSGADRNSRDHRGDTPLHWAGLAAHSKAVAYLLTRGAETSAKDDRLGRMPLHDAASKGFTEIVQLLLSRADVNAKDKENGATALHLAAWFGRLEVMDQLVEHHAEVEPKDNNECTPLHWAVIGNQPEAVHFLLEHGAKLDKVGGKYKRTPLHMACEWGFTKIVNLLLKRGANCEAVEQRKLCRPLHLAAQYAHPAVIELLLEKQVDVFAKDEKGFTPLHLAVREGTSANEDDVRKWREAELLMKMGLGAQTLEDIVEAGRSKPTDDLLRSKLLNQSSQKRMDEATIRRCEVINLLLDYAPTLLRVKSKKYGRSALHVAALSGQVAAVETLMAREADALELDKIGKSPLRLAFDSGKYDVVRFFVKVGITK